MPNERLWSAMAAARVDVEAVSKAADVDVKSVQRWLRGQHVPHERHRWAIANLLKEDEAFLWPSSRARGRAADATAEVISAYAHRVDVPASVWCDRLARAERQIELLAYAMLFLPEQQSDFAGLLKDKASAGCRVRIALADPDCPEVRARDELEQLNGTLPARIQTTLKHLAPVADCPNVEVRHHCVPLYNATYRFDDEMLVTPYLYGAHGFQHPVLHLRQLGRQDGMFSGFVNQFEVIWTRTAPAYRPTHAAPRRAGRGAR